MKNMIPALLLVFSSSASFANSQTLVCNNNSEQNLVVVRDFDAKTVESTLTTADLVHNFTGTMDLKFVITMNPTAENESVSLSIVRSYNRGGGCLRCGDGGSLTTNAQLIVGAKTYLFKCD